MLFLDQSENDEKYYELNDYVIKLHTTWRNELQAPEILPYEKEIVSTVKHLIEQQQAFIDDKLDDPNEEEAFTIVLYQSDIERVRFSLMKYLRTRIVKIENQLEHILGDLQLLERLSSTERIFATKLNNLTNQFMEDTIISRLPQNCADYFLENNDRYKHAVPKLQVVIDIKVFVVERLLLCVIKQYDLKY
eukprot:scaffold4837_cov163-Ochromonas_danica.AAC.2